MRTSLSFFKGEGEVVVPDDKEQVVTALRARVKAIRLKLKKDNPDSRTVLHQAAYQGDLELVQWLVSRGEGRYLDVAAKDRNGKTALHCAAEGGHLKTLQWLASWERNRPLNVAKKDRNGATALHAAARNGHLKTVQWLVSPEGGNLNVAEKDYHGSTALHFAAQGRHLKTVQWLVSPEGGNLNIAEKDDLGATAVHYAAWFGDLKMMQWLLQEEGVSMDEADLDGKTALGFVALKGRAKRLLKLYVWLEKNKTSLSQETECDKLNVIIHYRGFDATELYFATLDALIHFQATGLLNNAEYHVHFKDWLEKFTVEEHEALLLKTLKVAGNAEAEFLDLLSNDAFKELPKDNLIHSVFSLFTSEQLVAVKLNYEEKMQPVIKVRAETIRLKLENDNPHNRTVLHEAASQGDLELVQWLASLKGGKLNLSEKDKYGRTAIHHAAEGGDLKTVQWLVSPEGGNLNVAEKDKDGRTALHFAAAGGHLKTVQWLVSPEGGNLNVAEKTKKDETALHYAAWGGHLKTVQWLVSPEGGNLNIAKKTCAGPWLLPHPGTTALHCAAWGGHLKTVQWLVSPEGGKLNVAKKATNGVTALLCAAWRGRLKTVQWLLQEGGASIDEAALDGKTALDVVEPRGKTKHWLELYAWLEKNKTHLLQETVCHKLNHIIHYQEGDAAELYFATLDTLVHFQSTGLLNNAEYQVYFKNWLEKLSAEQREALLLKTLKVVGKAEAELLDLLSNEAFKELPEDSLIYSVFLLFTSEQLVTVKSNYEEKIQSASADATGDESSDNGSDTEDSDNDEATVQHGLIQKGYYRNRVSGDGDCGYKAFGITREQAHAFLSEKLEEIREIIQPAVKTALVTEKFFIYLQKQEAVDNDVTYDKVEEFIDGYANDLRIINAYLMYDVVEGNIEAGYAHPSVIQALADIREIRLRIWRLGDNNELLPHQLYDEDYADYVPVEGYTETTDLLYVNNNHFERLDLEGYADDEEPEAPIYPLRLIPHRFDEVNDPAPNDDSQGAGDEGNTAHPDETELKARAEAIRLKLENNNPIGKTVLHEAAHQGDLELVQWLVSPIGGNVNVAEKAADGRTALHFAARSGDLKTVQWLVSPEGGNLNVAEKNKDGRTALHYAAWSGDLKTVQWLVSSEGGNLNVAEKDEDGATALHCAVEGGHLKTVQWLVSPEGGKLNVAKKATNGVTALHFAVGNGHLKTVQWLLQEGGASIDEAALDGKTALDVVEPKGITKHWLELYAWLEKNKTHLLQETVCDKLNHIIHYQEGDAAELYFATLDTLVHFQSTGLVNKPKYQVHFKKWLEKFIAEQHEELLLKTLKVEGRSEGELLDLIYNEAFKELPKDSLIHSVFSLFTSEQLVAVTLNYEEKRRPASADATGDESSDNGSDAEDSDNDNADNDEVNVQLGLTEKGYLRHRVRGDGDCGYTAFGITREQAHTFLSEKLEEIREIIQPAVKTALVTEKFFIYLQKQEAVDNDVTYDKVEEFIDGYANDLRIINAYLMYDVVEGNIEAGYAHPSMIQALADICGVRLRIWRLGENNELLPHRLYDEDYADYVPVEGYTQTTDLLYVNNNHFERLDLEGYADDEEPEAPIYPLQLIPHRFDEVNDPAPNDDSQGACDEGNAVHPDQTELKARAEAIRLRLEKANPDKITALHEAASQGDLELVQWLVSPKGGNLNVAKKDRSGKTALHWAAWHGHLKTVQWLVSPEGGKLNVAEKTEYGSTALHWAAWMGYLKTVQWLLHEGGASIEVLDVKTWLDFQGKKGKTKHWLELYAWLEKNKTHLLQETVCDKLNHIIHYQEGDAAELYFATLDALIHYQATGLLKNAEYQVHFKDWLKTCPVEEHEELLLKVLKVDAGTHESLMNLLVDDAYKSLPENSISRLVLSLFTPEQLAALKAAIIGRSEKANSSPITQAEAEERLQAVVQEVNEVTAASSSSSDTQQMAAAENDDTEETRDAVTAFVTAVMEEHWTNGFSQTDWNRVIRHLENQFGIDLQTLPIGEAAGRVVTTIKEKLQQSASLIRWRMPERELGTKPGGLFLIHPIMGGVGEYKALCRQLNMEVLAKQNLALYIYQSPLLQETMDSSAFTTEYDDWCQLEYQAKQAIQAIKAVQPHGPYYFCGWSYGGVLTLEIVRLLKKAKQDVHYIGLVDPQLPAELRSLDKASLTQRLLMHINFISAYKLKLKSDLLPVSSVSDLEHEGEDFIKTVFDLALQNLTEHSHHPNHDELRKTLLTLQANYLAVYGYTRTFKDEQRLEHVSVYMAKEAIPQLKRYEFARDDLFEYSKVKPIEPVIDESNHFDIINQDAFANQMMRHIDDIASLGWDEQFLSCLQHAYAQSEMQHLPMLAMNQALPIGLCEFPINLDNAFSTTQHVAQFAETARPKRLLITGASGMGKTTFAKQLVQKSFEPTVWSDIRWVFYLPLRQLQVWKQESDYPVKNDHQLLPRILYHAYFKSAGLSFDAVVAFWERRHAAPEDICFIVDDVDEVIEDSELSHTLDMLFEVLHHSQVSVVVCARDYYLSSVQKKLSFNPSSDAVHQLKELDDTYIDNFIHSYFQAIDDEADKASALLDWLSKAPDIRQLCQTPLYLTTLCALWQHQSSQLQQQFDSQQSISLRDLMALWVQQRFDRRQDASSVVENLRDKATQQQVKRCLQQCAYVCAEQKVLPNRVTTNALQNILIEYGEMSVRGSLLSGCLVPIRQEGLMLGQSSQADFTHFEFNHPMMALYFTSERLLEALQENQPNDAEILTLLKYIFKHTDATLIRDFIITPLMRDEHYQGLSRLLKFLVEHHQNGEFNLYKPNRLHFILQLLETTGLNEDNPEQVSLLRILGVVHHCFTSDYAKATLTKGLRDEPDLENDALKAYKAIIKTLGLKHEKIFERALGTIDNKVTPRGREGVLHYAVTIKDAGLMKLLLRLGANPQKDDGTGVTPMGLTQKSQFVEGQELIQAERDRGNSFKQFRRLFLLGNPAVDFAKSQAPFRSYGNSYLFKH